MRPTFDLVTFSFSPSAPCHTFFLFSRFTEVCFTITWYFSRAHTYVEVFLVLEITPCTLTDINRDCKNNLQDKYIYHILTYMNFLLPTFYLLVTSYIFNSSSHFPPQGYNHNITLTPLNQIADLSSLITCLTH